MDAPDLSYENDIESVYHDCRITFSNQDSSLNCLEDKQFLQNCRSLFIKTLRHALQNEYFSEYTAGFEKLNRKGDTVKYHVHLRFSSKKETQSMRRRFKQWLSEEGQDTTGNKNFMFKACVIRSREEFFQYPLKQNLLLKICGGFAPDKLQLMHEVAKASYMKVIQCNQNKLDKMDDKDTLFQRTILRIKNKKIPNLTMKDICKEFVSLYVEESRPLNHSVITGYTTTASVVLGIQSIDALVDSWGY